MLAAKLVSHHPKDSRCCNPRSTEIPQTHLQLRCSQLGKDAHDRAEFHVSSHVHAWRFPLSIMVEGYRVRCGRARALSVGAERRDMLEFKNTVKEYEASGGIPFTEWWATVGKIKSLPQWKTKLVSLGGSEERTGSIANLADMGTFIFQHLGDDERISAAALQAPLPI